MWRYLVGVGVGAVLAVGGILLWKPAATAGSGPRAGLAEIVGSPAAPPADDALPEPPAATEKTREQKRFSRYDHDKDGSVSRDEYLAARHKAFAKLDVNGDGRLSFDEWAVKAETKFAAADADKSNALTPAEFATTRVVRKTRPRPACPPNATPAPAPADEES